MRKHAIDLRDKSDHLQLLPFAWLIPPETVLCRDALVPIFSLESFAVPWCSPYEGRPSLPRWLSLRDLDVIMSRETEERIVSS